MKIGFVGLGLMGNPMAKNLQKTGFDLTVFNRSKDKIYEFKKLGVKVAYSLKNLARESDIIITMVTGPRDVQEILFGKDGLGSRDGQQRQIRRRYFRAETDGEDGGAAGLE